MTDLYDYINPKTGKHSPMISKELMDIINDNADQLNSAIIYDRDYSYNYFGFKVLILVRFLLRLMNPCYNILMPLPHRLWSDLIC